MDTKPTPLVIDMLGLPLMVGDRVVFGSRRGNSAYTNHGIVTDIGEARKGYRTGPIFPLRVKTAGKRVTIHYNDNVILAAKQWDKEDAT